jgi:hypothetical protein
LVFGPNGNLFVSSQGTLTPSDSFVQEYNGTTGALEKTFVPSGSGGLTEGTYLVFHSVPATGAPEPATLGLMVLGLLGAGFAGRRRRN